MTSLLLDSSERTSTGRAQRPLVLIATLGGAAAALAPLLVCVAVGIIGWFAADAGAHGVPRDGMSMGAVARLMAHGSGITVRGVAVDAVPLGLTAICASVDVATGPPGRRRVVGPRARRRPDLRRGARLHGAAGDRTLLHRLRRRGRRGGHAHGERRDHPERARRGHVEPRDDPRVRRAGHRGRLRPGRDLGDLRARRDPTGRRHRDRDPDRLPRPVRRRLPRLPGRGHRPRRDDDEPAAPGGGRGHRLRRRQRRIPAQRDPFLRLLPARPGVRGRRQHPRLARRRGAGPAPVVRPAGGAAGHRHARAAPVVPWSGCRRWWPRSRRCGGSVDTPP
ncbi:hypothetical protein LP418_16860 [Nocardioides sp. B-3]|nr:hypothetical protein [Nocardioides sp. B-3]UUZ57992.1 hypothetical protein LP418_16860 [Nocardioides sp. B-3]